MRRDLRAIQKAAFLRLHKLGIRLGIHILPVHYYSPVPNVLELQRTKPLWARKSDLPGVAVDLDEQVRNLRTICLPNQKEYVGNKIYREGAISLRQAYGYIEARALHAVIRHYQPRRIIEVGSGLSTYCMLAALKLNQAGNSAIPSMTSIDPYPSPSVRSLGEVKFTAQPVQNVPLEVFGELGENDLLFHRLFSYCEARK